MFSLNEIILLLVAGFGAGIVTGLAGASAATVVTPLLVTFSPIAAYTAITFSLITDVFASFFSFLTYKKNGNINIKDGVYLTITASIGSVLGSWFSNDLEGLGWIGGLATFLLGLNFLRKGITLRKNLADPDYVKPEPKPSPLSKYNPIFVSSILGLILGLICGIVGAGGGLMILYVLTSVLNYDTKTAIGTSVLIMTFTALTGGLSHLYVLGTENIVIILTGIGITSIAGVIGAKVGAAFANKTTEDILLTMVGAIFTILTLLMVIFK